MPDTLLSLVTVAVVATVTPGPSTLLAAAAGARYGFRRRVPLMFGVTAGLISVVAAAAGGLAALLQAAPTLQAVMKVIGSAYLIWLAWKIAASGVPHLAATPAALPMGFRTGLVVLLLNPKAWFMALGAAGAFAGLAVGPVHLALLLGAVFGASAGVALSLWCAGGQSVGRHVRTAGQWRAVNGMLGLLTAASVVPLWL